MLEFSLVLFSLYCAFSVVSTIKTSRKIMELEEENSRYSSALLLPSEDIEDKESDYIEHDWCSQNIETVFHSSLTFDTVKVSTYTCSRCRMVHRHIYHGFSLAKRKNLASIEGFYKNGVKCVDRGCIKNSNKESIDK